MEADLVEAVAKASLAPILFAMPSGILLKSAW
jgi:hypothetical protein